MKTGGRVKGSLNLPKVIITPEVTPVVTAVAAPAAAAAAPLPVNAGRVRVRGKRKPRPSRAKPRAAPKPDLLAVELVVETWPISRLVEYGRNPRNHEGDVGRMADQIREYGFRIPIVARSDGTIVDGHLRYKAARLLKLARVPVALADDLTETQTRAFRLAANRSAEWATWNPEMLGLEIKDLQLDKFTLDLTGFNPGELAGLLGEPQLPAVRPVRSTTRTVTCPQCRHVFPP